MWENGVITRTVTGKCDDIIDSGSNIGKSTKVCRHIMATFKKGAAYPWHSLRFHSLTQHREMPNHTFSATSRSCIKCSCTPSVVMRIHTCIHAAASRATEASPEGTTAVKQTVRGHFLVCLYALMFIGFLPYCWGKCSLWRLLIFTAEKTNGGHLWDRCTEYPDGGLDIKR